MYCRKCGTKIDDSSNFCPVCGNETGNGDRLSEQQTSGQNDAGWQNDPYYEEELQNAGGRQKNSYYDEDRQSAAGWQEEPVRGSDHRRQGRDDYDYGYEEEDEYPYYREPKKPDKRSRMIVIASIIVIILAIAAVIIFVVLPKTGEEKTSKSADNKDRKQTEATIEEDATENDKETEIVTTADASEKETTTAAEAQATKEATTSAEETAQRETEAPTKATEQEATKAPDKEVDVSAYTVSFDRTYDGGNEIGLFTAYNGSGEVAWSFTTSYPAAQLSNVENIGIRGNRYYFVERGTVKSLNLADGSLIWENSEFGGSCTDNAFAFGDDGTIYLAGYFGPDFFAVDKNGNSIKKIATLNEDYMWPYDVKYLGDRLAISFEMGSDGGPGTVLYVDLKTFAVTGDEKEVAPPAEDTPADDGTPYVSSVSASSHLNEPQYGIDHTPWSVSDGDISTAWCEDAAGQGIGEWVALVFDKAYTVNGVTIYAGHQEAGDLYEKNSRPASMTIAFSDGSSQKIYLDDVMAGQTFTFESPVKTDSLTFIIDSVYEGYKYEDTLITEIVPF